MTSSRPNAVRLADELSPIAKCLQIAAARGRAIRLAREAQAQQADRDDQGAPSENTINNGDRCESDPR